MHALSLSGLGYADVGSMRFRGNGSSARTSRLSVRYEYRPWRISQRPIMTDTMNSGVNEPNKC